MASSRPLSVIFERLRQARGGRLAGGGDGYMNFFESQMVIVDNFTAMDFDFTFDVPGFVCDVDRNW